SIEDTAKQRDVMDRAKKNAICATIWGTSPDYVLGALVLGHSLRQHHAEELKAGTISLELLVERNVPDNHKQQLAAL
ncbi:unnamed protein product, partial [Amoebophrya sp. A25]